MYECKNCKAAFMTPVIEVGRGVSINERSLYCPQCMSIKIEHIEVGYCAFCHRIRVPKGKIYCNDTCERLGEEIRLRQEERRKRVREFDVSKAVREVEEYNKAHGTDYSYGKYFALKGLGEISDDQ